VALAPQTDLIGKVNKTGRKKIEAAVCLDAVAAIAQVLAYRLLRWENQAAFVQNCPKGLCCKGCRRAA
jgi:hypothetical protein